MIEVVAINKDSYIMRFGKSTPQWKELSDTLINDYLESGCTLNEHNEILNEDGKVIVRYYENVDEILFKMIKPKKKFNNYT